MHFATDNTMTPPDKSGGGLIPKKMVFWTKKGVITLGFKLNETLQASKAFIRKSGVFRFIDNPVKNYPKSGLIPNSDVSARYIRFRLKRD